MLPSKVDIGLISDRARESKSIVEQELLSSTSKDVCELWSGERITRTIGNTTFKDLLIDDQGRVFDLKTVYGGDFTDDEGPLAPLPITYDEWGSDLDVLHNLVSGPSNLTLNLNTFSTKKWEAYCFAFLGLLLQSGDFIYAAMVTYYWSWGSRTDYAFACFAMGSVVVITGMLICGRTIDNVTTEFEFYQNPKSERRITEVIRLQASAHVGDRHFDPYIITKHVKGSLVLRTSRLNDKKYQ